MTPKAERLITISKAKTKLSAGQDIKPSNQFFLIVSSLCLLLFYRTKMNKGSEPYYRQIETKIKANQSNLYQKNRRFKSLLCRFYSCYWLSTFVPYFIDDGERGLDQARVIEFFPAFVVLRVTDKFVPVVTLYRFHRQ